MEREKRIEVRIHSPVCITSLVDALYHEADYHPALAKLQTSVHRAIRGSRHRTAESYSYTYEEELLQAASRVSDFHILEVAEHFRQYHLRALPGTVGVRYLSHVQFDRIHKRPAGHVTGTFAEAICPWVLAKIGLTTAASVYRLGKLGTGKLHYLPDFIVFTRFGLIPCEVKHALDDSLVHEDRVGRAILQVAAAMDVINIGRGLVFYCLGDASSGARYRTDLIPLVLC